MSVCIHSIDISFHHSCRIPAFTEILPPLLSRGGGREKEALQCKRIRRDSWRGEGDCLLWNRLSGRTKHNGGGNIVKLLSKAGGCVALRVGVVENKHISGKNSPRRKKNAHREVQMCSGKVQALKKICDHAVKENGMSWMCPHSPVSLRCMEKVSGAVSFETPRGQSWNV